MIIEVITSTERRRRRNSRGKKDGRELVDEIQIILSKRPTYGYRRVTSLKSKGAHAGKVATVASNICWCSDSFSVERPNESGASSVLNRRMRQRSSEAIRDLMLESVEDRTGQNRLTAPVQ